ncbi:MAG: hypothetical protein WAW81_03325 [Minisyncoccia bacterium]
MFPKIEGFDDWVLQQIADINEPFAVVVCEIGRRHSNGAPAPGKKWGVYTRTTCPDRGPQMMGRRCNDREVRSCLIEEAKRVVFVASQLEAQIHYLKYEHILKS